MTLKPNYDLDILKMYLRTENKVLGVRGWRWRLGGAWCDWEGRIASIQCLAVPQVSYSYFVCEVEVGVCTNEDFDDINMTVGSGPMQRCAI